MKLSLMIFTLFSLGLASATAMATEADITGIFKLTSDNANGECPARVRVSSIEDAVTFAALGASESLVIEDGEKEKIKLSSKESYQIKGSIEDFELRLEGRYCKGKVFKKCDDWEVLAMIDTNGEELMISHRASPYMPRSGFPNGTCSYVRGL